MIQIHKKIDLFYIVTKLIKENVLNLLLMKLINFVFNLNFSDKSFHFPVVKACGKFDAVHVKYLKACNPLANLHLPAKVAKWIKWAG